MRTACGQSTETLIPWSPCVIERYSANATAAWRAAQASPAAPYLDYDWVIEVARAYEAYDVYGRVVDQTI